MDTRTTKLRTNNLGELEPSKTFDFEISSNNPIDILLFPTNSLEVYLNEQSYRNEMIWQQESVFENFNGDGEWHGLFQMIEKNKMVHDNR